jgi:hypothetical protein
MERLFDYLEIKSVDRGKHRLYHQEVVELSDDVSIILVLPTPQTVCFLETSQVRKFLDFFIFNEIETLNYFSYFF